MKKNKPVLVALCSIFLLGLLGQTSFAKPMISDSDLEIIHNNLEKLSNAMVTEDLGSILALLSPNMDKIKSEEIKDILDEKFSERDYTRYKLFPPKRTKIKVLDPDKKVEFKATFSEKYETETGSASESGFKSFFVMEKIGDEWLILDTNFHGPQNGFFSPGMVVGAILSIFFVIGLVSVMLIFWIWMIVDCAKREFKESNERVVWILILVFLQLLGAVIYYFVVKRKKPPAA